MKGENRIEGIGKRALSPVIAVVLLILITIAAGAIIAGFSIPFVRDGLDESTRCLDFNEYYSFKESVEFKGVAYQFNCFDKDKQGFSIATKSVENNSVKNLDGFNILFYGDKDTEILKMEKGKVTTGVNELGKISGNLEIPKQGEIRTYVYQTGERFNRMEVYPIVKGKICDKSDDIEIVTCVPGIFD
jgi:flagellin-like protein